MRARFTATLSAVTVLALAAFAVPAFAGDHGGGGRGHDQQQAAQQQSSQQSSQQQSSDQHGGWKHDQSSSGQQSSSSGGNSTGVKPSNTTKHDTYASASSNQTKQYGNGKTAGQIATQAGYGSATLHGPGNSQPHKTSCGGHEVDVHALKAHGGDCGQVQQSQNEQSNQVGQTKSSEQSNSNEQSKSSEQSTSNETEHEQESEAQSTENEQESLEQTKSAEQTQSPQTPPAVEMSHVTICHATGSASNPYVRISPSASGVFHGHMRHQDGRDIIPPFTWNGTTYSENWPSGEAIWDAGCVESQPAAGVQSSESTQSNQTQVTEENEATETEQESQSAEETESAPSQAAVTAQAPTAATQAPTASGVLGASVALKRPKAKPAAVRPATKKAAGGVLGTTTPLHSSITSATLPFTGLPLWPFLLGAVVLLAIGIATRFAAADRRAP